MDPINPTAWKEKTIFVVGDIMLDKFVYGNVERVSPEAPIPVLHFNQETRMPGGAANVARNVIALGGKAMLAGVVGNDDAGRLLADDLATKEGIEGRLVVTDHIPTTVKTRFVSGWQQIMRLDVETHLHMNTALEDELCQTLEDVIDRIDAIILSDYAKGLLTESLVRRIIRIANAHGRPVVVDPKTADVGRFSGATVLTPNALEAAMITGVKCHNDAAAEQAAHEILKQSGVTAVIITRSADGMTVLSPGMDVATPVHIPTNASEVYDVSGAGDTVAAALTLALATAYPVAQAAEIANVAAGISVGKRGTSVVYPHELRRWLNARNHDADQKIVDHEDALHIIQDWKRSGLKVGFTNGCYDLLHPGHVRLLKKARATCDRLVVALNTDASVRRLKGETRPVQHENARATVMACIDSVDLVTFFDDDTPLALIETLTPDVLVKGADYTVATVVGAEHVISAGGEVVLVPLEEGHSTTAIITRSKSGVAA